MEITLEQVERLREKADVSYGQAKQALEILSSAGETAYQIGEVVSGEDGVKLVP